VRDTAVPNSVTAILADYRGFDTLFETTVIFSAGLACFFLLRSFKSKQRDVQLYRHISTGLLFKIKKGGREPDLSKFEKTDSLWTPYDLITKTTCRLVIPFIQLFALYVIAHGHHSPGGGFQGGVILGASAILYAISHDLRATLRRFSERTTVLLSAVGVFIYAGAGMICLILGGNFLDYSALSPILGGDKIMSRSYGILIVEMGVGIAVMSVMIWIYYNISSAGKQDEGL
jgi:multicomponent Na+:H+ antiporter subunit B